jgi:DNA polymerase-3 subunit delta
MGEAPAFLLFMLARQMQLIVRMKELRAQGKAKTYIQQQLGLHNDFTWRKTLETSTHYNLPRMKKIYRKILETDIATKTGKYPAELALSILFAELCQPN